MAMWYIVLGLQARLVLPWVDAYIPINPIILSSIKHLLTMHHGHTIPWMVHRKTSPPPFPLSLHWRESHTIFFYNEEPTGVGFAQGEHECIIYLKH